MKRTRFKSRPQLSTVFANAVERDWRAQQPDECMLCGAPRTRHVWPCVLDTHEIVCGTGYRIACRSTPAGMLVLCRTCHDRVHAMAKEDAIVLGLAVKALKDLTYYDLWAVLRIRWPVTWKKWLREIANKVAAAVERLGGE